MKSFVLILTAALISAACGDNLQAAPPCLDRATDLARPPVGQLPCDLLPPGFGQ